MPTKCCGDELAAAPRHGEVRGCAQKKEGVKAKSMLTKTAAERGVLTIGDEVWRRRSSVVDEGDAPVILGTSEGAHGLREDAAMLMVAETGPELRRYRRNRRRTEGSPPAKNFKIRALDRDWEEEC